MGSKSNAISGLIHMFDASLRASKMLAIQRGTEAITQDYNSIVAYADEKELSFEKAAKEMGVSFTSTDKWALIKKALIDSSMQRSVSSVIMHDFKFAFTTVEARIRIIALLLEENYVNNNPTSVQDIIEKWGFSIGLYDPSMQMLTFLCVLAQTGSKVEATRSVGRISNKSFDGWRKHPEFNELYRSAIDTSIMNLEARLSHIATYAEKETDAIKAAEILLHRTERHRLGELYDALDPDGRKRELKKRAFIFAAEKGTNIKEALKLEDPDEYGGLDDITINLSPESMQGISAESPTQMLLQMRAMLDQYKNNANGS